MIVSLLRPFLRHGRRPQPQIAVDQIERILLIKPEKLGDMVIMLPLAQALRDRLPSVAIDLLASPKGEAIVREDPRFGKVWVYQKRARADLRTLRTIRRHRHDLVIDLIDDDSRTGLLLSQFCANGAIRIGANKRSYAHWYDLHTDYHEDRLVHAIDRALAILSLIGLNSAPANTYVPPFVPPRSSDTVDRFLAELSSSAPDRQLLAINISGGKSTRRWEQESVVRVIEDMCECAPSVQTVLISAPTERARSEWVAQRCPSAQPTPPNWSILDIAALLARMDLVVSPDTSIVHIARSFRVPVVGLYPALEETVRRWQPYGQSTGVVRSDDSGDITGIHPDRIVAEIKQALSQPQVRRA